MDFSKVTQWWKNTVAQANEQGLPVPMIRYRGEGNPALTLVFVSAAIVIVGIVGKWSGHLGGIDQSSAMSFFYACSTLFFGHSAINSPKNGQNQGP